EPAQRRVEVEEAAIEDGGGLLADGQHGAEALLDGLDLLRCHGACSRLRSGASCMPPAGFAAISRPDPMISIVSGPRGRAETEALYCPWPQSSAHRRSRRCVTRRSSAGRPRRCSACQTGKPVSAVASATLSLPAPPGDN